MAYYDFNVALPAPLFAPASSSGPSSTGQQQGKKNKKNKGQQQHQQTSQSGTPVSGSITPAQVEAPVDRLTRSQKIELEARVKDLRDLGYSTIAFNHIVHSKLDAAAHRNPLYASPAASSDVASSSAQTLDSTILMPAVSTPLFPHLAKGKSGITQLNRLTLVLDAESESKSGSNGLVPAASSTLMSYDLLAIRPLTATAFNTTCLSHTELKPGQSFDIISVDLSSKPKADVKFRRTTVGKALENGAVFEVCYSEALPVGSSSSGEPSHQDRLRNLVANTRDLLRVTNGGRGVILSSSASSVLGLRSPQDIINLASIFGFSPQLARDALTETSRRLLRRAETRRSFRGVTGFPKVVSVPTLQGEQEVKQLEQVEESLPQAQELPNGTNLPATTAGQKRKSPEIIDQPPPPPKVDELKKIPMGGKVAGSMNEPGKDPRKNKKQRQK